MNFMTIKNIILYFMLNDDNKVNIKYKRDEVENKFDYVKVKIIPTQILEFGN